jgi:hypothetical protein
MRVRFKKDSSKNDTTYAGTAHEFTTVSMGYGFRTDITNAINWNDTPEGDLVEADVNDAFMISGVKYVEHKRGNNWITPKILKK